MTPDRSSTSPADPGNPTPLRQRSDSLPDVSAATWIALGSAVIALVALEVAIYTVVTGGRQRRRQEVAALTGDLYPILRDLREAAFAYGKPLGGENPQALISINRFSRDLIDFHPGIYDEDLRLSVEELLGNSAIGAAPSIDPDRFMGMVASDHLLNEFLVASKLSDKALQRCQSLRQRVG